VFDDRCRLAAIQPVAARVWAECRDPLGSYEIDALRRHSEQRGIAGRVARWSPIRTRFQGTRHALYGRRLPGAAHPASSRRTWTKHAGRAACCELDLRTAFGCDAKRFQLYTSRWSTLRESETGRLRGAVGWIDPTRGAVCRRRLHRWRGNRPITSPRRLGCSSRPSTRKAATLGGPPDGRGE